MATDLVTLYNMALSLAETSVRVSDPTEKTPQAQNCNLWYENVRQSILKSAPWPCALAYARLAVTHERDFGNEWAEVGPAPGFRFAYAAPTLMLAPFHLQDYGQFERTVVQGEVLISTNTENAILRYVLDQPEMSIWDAGLVSAVANLLAYRITGTTSGKLGLRDRLMQSAKDAIDLAVMQNANEEELHVEALPLGVQARGYGDGRTTSGKYYFPFHKHNAVTP